MMHELDASCADGILTLTLNRPEKLNALSDNVLHLLSEQFERAKKDAAVKAILITGEGKAFCAGADIERLAECNAERGYAFACHGQHVFRQLETLGKPSLAAVNGYAFGGGCELAISATLRIASTLAQFGQPEIKLGVIPGYGGTQRLSRLIGKGRALDLCLTGRFIPAEMALSWGLVTEVTSPENLIFRGQEILKSIISLAPIAISSVMEVIDHGFDLSLEDAFHVEALQFARTCATSDKVEGVSAFLEKRKAVFKGV
jgi:enoyl-CoA hydratase